MLDQADDFYQVSGAQTVLEYKDVIEAQLRTYLKSGFQLLSINDFTGQGYAPVGILDPFWNSKGLITPEKFREFCAPTVALLRFRNVRTITTTYSQEKRKSIIIVPLP